MDKRLLVRLMLLLLLMHESCRRAVTDAIETLRSHGDRCADNVRRLVVGWRLRVLNDQARSTRSHRLRQNHAMLLLGWWTAYLVLRRRQQRLLAGLLQRLWAGQVVLLLLM